MLLSSGWDSFWELIVVLFIFLLVVGLTYFTTRFVGGYQREKLKSGNMQLVEAIRVGRDKYLQIVKIGTRFFVIAVGKDTVSTVAEIQEEDLNLQDDSSNGTMNFGSILDKFKKNKTEE